MNEELRGQVSAILDVMLGDASDPNGKLVSAVREQLEPSIAARLAPLQESITALRSAAESGPPLGQSATLVAPPPWATAAMGAAALGLPDANWYNPDAEGAELDGKFANFPDYLKAVIRSGRGVGSDSRLKMVTTKGISAELTGEEIELGGALVPEEFRPLLLNMMLQMTSIRARAMVIPMGSSSVTLPAIRTESHASGDVFGGVKFNWLEVNDEIPDTEPDFKLIQLNARALAGRTLIPNTLIEDSFITVPMLIMQLWQQAVPWIEEKNFIRGDGVGKPLGVLNSPALATHTRATSDEFSVADMYSMMSRLLPGSHGRAVWLINPEVIPQLGTLNQNDVQSWHPSLQLDMPGMLAGKPVIFNEHCSGLGATGDVMLVDWMYYLIGDRQSLSMAASPHEQFSRNRTVVRGIERIDGVPWLDTPVIPAQRASSTFTISPFVALGTI